MLSVLNTLLSFVGFLNLAKSFVIRSFHNKKIKEEISSITLCGLSPVSCHVHEQYKENKHQNTLYTHIFLKSHDFSFQSYPISTLDLQSFFTMNGKDAYYFQLRGNFCAIRAWRNWTLIIVIITGSFLSHLKKRLYP